MSSYHYKTIHYDCQKIRCSVYMSQRIQKGYEGTLYYTTQR